MTGFTSLFRPVRNFNFDINTN